ncbi:MAG: DUF4870 domain-containing protein [bacterium]|nr:DUF4870 domain-containing protein [bacterium]
MPEASEKDARTFAMLSHLLGIIGFLGPLIVWLIKREEHPFVDDQGKEALNFQITMLIGYVISAVLAFVLIGVFTSLALTIANIVLCIMAGLKANEGETYRYPFNLRLIK